MAFEIRENRGRAQGRKKLVREREEYLRLMGEGLSNRQACQIVGINRRTGMRWRNGRAPSARQAGASPITVVAPPSGPSRYLREDDRVHIADRLENMVAKHSRGARAAGAGAAIGGAGAESGAR
ncbi:hypothetical protein GCM10023195_24840 [Actinoallomurus liliacearum]|uniref:Homeodomain-like domain-containing protein n=1 Tax=Actinoallomurus liliacearum TaxID=1080073 RepID=A0ABP8TF78_9ACTN